MLMKIHVIEGNLEFQGKLKATVIYPMVSVCTSSAGKTVDSPIWYLQIVPGMPNSSANSKS